MRRTFYLLLGCLFSYGVQGQFVAKLEVVETIDGLCDVNEVYVLFPSFEGQEEADCPVTNEEILRRLNSEVQYLKDHPKHKDKGMIGLIIDCDGKLIQCKIDGNNRTASQELDAQIEAVFNSLGNWISGKLDGKDVDSSMMFSFTIKKGVISF